MSAQHNNNTEPYTSGSLHIDNLSSDAQSNLRAPPYSVFMQEYGIFSSLSGESLSSLSGGSLSSLSGESLSSLSGGSLSSLSGEYLNCNENEKANFFNAVNFAHD